MQERLIREVIEPMACDGLRTICIAYRDFVPSKAAVNEVHIENDPNFDDEENIISNLTCLCVVGTYKCKLQKERQKSYTCSYFKNYMPQ